jgi:GNAT superfamily N-acetyltransferase
VLLLKIFKFGIGIFSFFIMSFLCADESTIHMKVLQGEVINSIVKEITDLSLIIYREYPYLYEGTEEEYLPLIQHYVQSENGIACLLFDQEKPIGVAIGMPMSAMRENYKQPILNYFKKIDVDSMFYLGEFLLLEEYRGKGLGKKMYNEFERLVKEKGSFETICFCKISEFDSHPLMPANYRALDDFWNKLGFEKQEDLNFSVFWCNVSEIEDSSHKLIYWMKFLRF